MTVACPFVPPKQDAFTLVVVAASTGGCVIVTVCVIIQPFASVIVQVYVPIARPVAVALVPPVGNHAYVYAGVPPPTLTVAVPFDPPKQETFVCVAETVNAAGCVMLNVAVVTHAFASVIVQVYVPAASPDAVAFVPPLGNHAYV
jgi:hypothetical protein